MRPYNLDVNGKRVTASAEPRTSLADFLRGALSLTGTHIGCEHGVCGACTVLIDGVPARSCITYAVACEGASVTTIEGLRDDALMAELRAAFSKHHALQCGYCTPAMLISCRDIALRLPEADEARIRIELSGNLCRCTGYVGIVAALKEVMATRKLAGAEPVLVRTKLGPAGAHAALVDGAAAVSRVSEDDRRSGGRARAENRAEPIQRVSAEQWRAVEKDGVELQETFSVPFAREEVWRAFADLDKIARCMPGARLTTPEQDGRAFGEVAIKLGPILSRFAGVLEVERNAAEFRGLVRGAGRDASSGSNARALIGYRLSALNEVSCRVDVSLKFLLTGALAQFGRSGLVKDVADHLTRVFASNLEAALSGKAHAGHADGALDAGKLARAAVWQRLRAWIARIFPS